MKLRLTEALKTFGSHLLLIVLSFISLFPAFWIIMSSFKTGNSLFSDSLIPKNFTFVHYKELFEQTKYLLWFMNTLKIAALSTLLGTFLLLLTSYAISRYRFTGRKTTLTTLLVLQMFPGFMAMIAVYVLLNTLGLLNSHWALVLVYSSGAIITNVFVAKGFFDTIPKSLEDAARMDGASHMKVFLSIMIPLSKPMLTYASLMIFNGCFVDFIFADLVLRTEDTRTLAVGLYRMVNQSNSTEFTLFAAGAVLVALPVTLLFIFLQRFLVDGLTAGASKG
ncbi:sugar ABC transporter permease [Paenibacillus sp. FSL R7-0048]|jgi:arabinogalactan oligomer/maltooligosaccharide transport system permease protein|uniref:Sugar ABC transporter permease n=1 Tax=Paenibacillus odorifer TaxID=189426 RepID=A0ABX3GH15_9BACL|nr:MULTISPECIES: sugar ABC transporter permease [Paenibacillus]MDH6430336.1 arabinogalactan oligomer/maltooligosaccharide transport system permease protein [Paenibacillus sp. PastH-4]MDH6446927.1 arabinogalactan oligomer/maltooligosaccharide transport system permease protein [Paenibacillus sp. PastF-4]MDH6530728.1 arabinogalactan oligomer/maltooligosaccharide transport system permease protein [Paenibacillus sp. PastH-3]OMC62738.1 sugar ABC transporter permease [Paenibacillus odorifer]OMC74187.